MSAAVDGACFRPDDIVCLGGNADRAERDPERLAGAHARAVARWLIDHGVSPDRIATTSLGARRPVDVRRTAGARALARRVDISDISARAHCRR